MLSLYSSNHDADELAQMRRIPVHQLAESLGWVRDKIRSTRSQPVLVGPGGERIGCRKSQSGDCVYFDYVANRGGSAIDFVQAYVQPGTSLGEARKFLRAYLGLSQARPSQPAQSQQQAYSATIARKWRGFDTDSARGREYLAGRGLPARLVQAVAHSDGLRFDGKSALFPHRDEAGAIIGWECKNGWPPMPPGGQRSIWKWSSGTEHCSVVVAESAIDALSYHCIHPTGSLVSIGGTPCELGLSMLCKSFADSTAPFLLALDNDAAGHRFAARIGNVLSMNGFNVEPRYPPRHKDWNDELKSKRGIR